jgi:hypothetical protein
MLVERCRLDVAKPLERGIRRRDAGRLELAVHTLVHRQRRYLTTRAECGNAAVR